MGSSMKVVMLTRKGGPEVLEVQEAPLPEPGPGELRVRVLATGVGSTDVTMRRGYYPFAPPVPFVPGYESVGRVDAVGAGVTGFSVGQKVGALLVHGGYATHVVRAAQEWFHVPENLDSAEVAALILNYGTAWQIIHREARMQPGQTALVTAAAGGVGQALVQLLVLHGCKVLAAASASRHPMLAAMGAIPVEGRSAPVDVGVRAVAPQGVDAALDGVGGQQLRECVAALRRGGILVWYGFMGTGNAFSTVGRNYWDTFVGTRLQGKRGTFYGITAQYRKNPGPLREDLPKLLQLLGEGKIRPRISARLPLLAAREANERIEKGGVDGKLVLVAEG